jgi:sRNA-binding regulator protein Hfq
MSENLVGKNIHLFMDGGWEISGVVKTQDKEKLILEKDGILKMVFKQKVSALFLNMDNKQEKEEPKESDDVIEKDESDESEMFYEDEPFPINPISYSESSMSLPLDILGNPKVKNDDDFSISFSGSVEEEASQKDRKPKIQFKLEE